MNGRARHATEPARTGRGGAGWRYFSDGGHLYLFIEWVARSKDSMVAAVEDCRSLEILLVSAEQLRSWSEVPST